MVSVIICKHCKSNNNYKKGFRRTEFRGKIQKYYCKTCHKFFTNDDGFYRMRNNPGIITMSIDMYVSNLSSRKMRNQLKRHLNYKISHISILDWVRRYALRVSRFVERLGYNLGESFYADETVIFREGKQDKFWCCLDWDTRLITGFHYSLSANPTQAQEFLKKAISKGKPKYIQTDAGVFYPRAFKKLFYSNKLSGLTIEHKIQNYQTTHIHNYRIETVFMKIKDRVLDFRGLKALWSAPILMTAIVIQHNFIENHSTTDEVPCDSANADLNLSENRWLDLIHLSANK
ncbi:IS1/IS6 family transposase [Candidatus Pacearchaeota archaeon]|nr:IS1/IS6 family transposase [Candidatus Pacearchaeota archaeon]